MNPDLSVDYLIIGAGPAGLQLGYFLDKSKRDYLILDAGEKPGLFFETFPRHRRLLTVNKIYTGYQDPERQLRYDWNSLLSDNEQLLFRNYSKEFLPGTDDFLRYLGDFAAQHQLRIQFGTRVTRISKQDRFLVQDHQGQTYSARRLILATGLSKSYIPDIPGIELTENYMDFSVNAADFINQRVLILGKGNSAFETATHLIPTARMIHLCGPKCVTMAYSSHYKGDVRAVNSAIIDTYHLKNQNNILNADVTQIERRGGELIAHIAFTQAKGQTMQLAYDRILVCTGFRMDTSIFDESCQPEMMPELRHKYPAMTSEWESVNVKDMYFIGVLMGAKDRRKYFSSFVSGFRYNIRVLHKLMERKYHGAALPYESAPLDPESLADLILERVSRASALLLQQGFIADVLTVDPERQQARYYQEVNLEYVHDRIFREGQQTYTVTLEYGPFPKDAALCVERDPDPDEAHKDVYIHPIIRRYDGKRLASEHHVPEVLENDWRIFQFMRQVDDQGPAQLQQMYKQRLTRFFAEELSSAEMSSAESDMCHVN